MALPIAGGAHAVVTVPWCGGRALRRQRVAREQVCERGFDLGGEPGRGPAAGSDGRGGGRCGDGHCPLRQANALEPDASQGGEAGEAVGIDALGIAKDVQEQLAQEMGDLVGSELAAEAAARRRATSTAARRERVRALRVVEVAEGAAGEGTTPARRAGVGAGGTRRSGTCMLALGAGVHLCLRHSLDRLSERV
jgi:hypothetical protein